MKHIDIDINMLNKHYQEFCSLYKEVTEAPLEFLVTTLITAIASAISLNRYIQWGSQKIYPNIWSVILGESTLTRKTTALNIGTEFISQKQSEDVENLFLLPEISSQNVFIETLSESKFGLIKVGEIKSFQSNLDKSYNDGMKAKFTEMFDVPSSITLKHRTINKGKHQIINKPIFSIAAASTKDWFRSSLGEYDVSSGFLARFIFCNGESNRIIPIPKIVDKAKEMKLLNQYIRLYDLNPLEITMSVEAKKYYTDYYYEISNEIKKGNALNLNPFIGRLRDNYCIKFAIIEATLKDKTIISGEMMNSAIYLSNFYKDQINSIISSFNTNKRRKIEDSIIELLKNSESCSKTELRKSLQLNTVELNETISSLLEAEIIKAESNFVGKARRPTKFFSLV